MPIPPKDLATFRELTDGNLEVALQRYGRLIVRLPNSAQSIEISIKRDKQKNFRCFVATTVSGDEKQNEAARKANGGVTPEVNHILSVDGRLNPTDHETKSARKQSTGSKAAAADDATGEPAGVQSASASDPAGGDGAAPGESASEPAGEETLGQS